MAVNKGTTLIEVLVGIFIFSIVVILAGAIFVQSLKGREQAKDLSVLQDDARYILDYMAREIRASEITQINNNTLTLNDGDVIYEFLGTNILREGNALNSVAIADCDFSGNHNPKPGIVTIIIKFTDDFEVQTTISSRVY